MDFFTNPSHSRTMGILTLLLLVLAVPLTIVNLQQPQEIRQHAATIAAETDLCPTDANAIRWLLGPQINSCGDYAIYYCRSDTTDQMGTDIPDENRRGWGDKLKNGEIRYNLLRPKTSYIGPATDYYMRVDAPPWAFGRSGDSIGLHIPTAEQRLDMLRLMQAGEIWVIGVCGSPGTNTTQSPIPSSTPTSTPKPTVHDLPPTPGTISDDFLSGTGAPSGRISNRLRLIPWLIVILLIIATLLSLLYFILGAIDWIRSEGDPKKFAAARRKLLFALFGLVIALLSFFIVRSIGTSFGVPILKAP